MGADDASTSISQDVQLAGGDDASTSISQDVQLVGGDDAKTFISQFISGAAPDDARTFISQFCLLVSYGEPVPILAGVFRFDAGQRSSWWLVPQLTDSGNELRDKVVKAVHVTGKMTAPQFKIYAYQPEQEIDVEAIEDGDDGTKSFSLEATTEVTQGARKQINVPNAELHTIRLQGSWVDDGNMKDRIDEIVYEQAIQGTRR